MNSITIYPDNVFWQGVSRDDELYPHKQELAFNPAAQLPEAVQKVLGVVAERQLQLPSAFSHLAPS